VPTRCSRCGRRRPTSAGTVPHRAGARRRRLARRPAGAAALGAAADPALTARHRSGGRWPVVPRGAGRSPAVAARAGAAGPPRRAGGQLGRRGGGAQRPEQARERGVPAGGPPHRVPRVVRCRAQRDDADPSWPASGQAAATGATRSRSAAVRSINASRPRLVPSELSAAPIDRAYSAANARSSTLLPAVGHQMPWRTRSSGVAWSRAASGPRALTSTAIGSVVTSSALSSPGSASSRLAAFPNARSSS